MKSKTDVSRPSRRGRRKRRGDRRVLAADQRSLAEWQASWFELREHPWRTLSFVPAGSTPLAVEIARNMAAVATRFESSEIEAVDATGATIDDCRARLEDISTMAQRGCKAIVAVENPLVSPVAVPIVRSTSASVLLVALETTSLRDARAVLHRLGEDRFIGCMTLSVKRRGWLSRRRESGPLPCEEPLWADNDAGEDANRRAGEGGGSPG